MRLPLAALALGLAIAACSAGKDAPQPTPPDAVGAIDPAADAGPSGADSPDTTADGEAKTIEEMRAASLAEIDQEACRGAGGEVRQEGMLGMYRCVKPYADAGKACRSKSDCEGKCLATDDAAPDAEVTGACQANDSPFGCYAEVEDGKVTGAICVD